MLKTIVAVFLVLHGLVHAIMAMVPSPNTPDAGFATFYSGLGSWLLSRLGLPTSATRMTAIVLSAIATLGFVATGVALLGVIPFDWWRALAIASAAVSLLLIVLFWDRYLIVGLLIDVAILVTLLLTKWSPE